MRWAKDHARGLPERSFLFDTHARGFGPYLCPDPFRHVNQFLARAGRPTLYPDRAYVPPEPEPHDPAVNDEDGPSDEEDYPDWHMFAAVIFSRT